MEPLFPSPRGSPTFTSTSSLLTPLASALIISAFSISSSAASPPLFFNLGDNHDDDDDDNDGYTPFVSNLADALGKSSRLGAFLAYLGRTRVERKHYRLRVH